MKKGLRRFENDHSSISSFLYHSILGQPWIKTYLDIKPPENLTVPGLPKLNFYQQEAVRRALMEPLCLIQGPPGTGKTVTSASIVFHLVKQTKRQVLVCAPSNVVVDMLAQRIHQTGVKVLRFCSKSRESVSSDV
jgi:regulator of nonsense transcripts 1